jgi:hypothetical protein
MRTSPQRVYRRLYCLCILAVLPASLCICPLPLHSYCLLLSQCVCCWAEAETPELETLLQLSPAVVRLLPACYLPAEQTVCNTTCCDPLFNPALAAYVSCQNALNSDGKWALPLAQPTC